MALYDKETYNNYIRYIESKSNLQNVKNYIKNKYFTGHLSEKRYEQLKKLLSKIDKTKLKSIYNLVVEKKENIDRYKNILIEYSKNTNYNLQKIELHKTYLDNANKIIRYLNYRLKNVKKTNN
jgi:CRISPR/Cas system-associated endoribonuclease Cas2